MITFNVRVERLYTLVTIGWKTVHHVAQKIESSFSIRFITCLLTRYPIPIY